MSPLLYIIDAKDKKILFEIFEHIQKYTCVKFVKHKKGSKTVPLSLGYNDG